MDIIPPTHERIRIVQKQLRTAIQNHQVLVLRRRVCPGDHDVLCHLHVIQALIIAMGRSQSDLMAQLRTELLAQYDEKTAEVEMAKLLSWPETPKNIPVYKKPVVPNGVPDEKKSGPWKAKKEIKFLKLSSKMQSLLKVKNENDNPPKSDDSDGSSRLPKVKLLNNKPDEFSKRDTRKLQSVLKSKSINSLSNNEVSKVDTNLPMLPESKGHKPSPIRDSKCKTSLTDSESQSDDTESAEIIPLKPVSPNENGSRSTSTSPKPSQKKYEPKVLSRSRTRAQTASLRRDIKHNFDIKEELMLISSKGECMNGNSGEDTLRNFSSIDEAGQDYYLGYFGLVNKSQFDLLKRKRCERKRRSVAGQSSLYSDYFQPPTPKRTYGPRKPAASTSPTNQVIVETATDIEDDDDKPIKSEAACSICYQQNAVSLENMTQEMSSNQKCSDHCDGALRNVGPSSFQTSVLDVCHSCSDTYHVKCLPVPSTGCPTCSAIPSNINNIVEASSVDISSTSTTSSELIKRYLTSTGETEDVNQEVNIGTEVGKDL